MSQYPTGVIAKAYRSGYSEQPSPKQKEANSHLEMKILGKWKGRREVGKKDLSREVTCCRSRFWMWLFASVPSAHLWAVFLRGAGTATPSDHTSWTVPQRIALFCWPRRKQIIYKWCAKGTWASIVEKKSRQIDSRTKASASPLLQAMGSTETLPYFLLPGQMISHRITFWLNKK